MPCPPYSSIPGTLTPIALPTPASPAETIPSPAPPAPGATNLLPTPTSPLADPARRRSVLAPPSIAILLGVNTRWKWPLFCARLLSTLPAAWWGFRCLLTFVSEVLVGHEVAVNRIGSGNAYGYSNTAGGWTFERRFMVTEVFLALLWVGFYSSIRTYFEKEVLTIL